MLCVFLACYLPLMVILLVLSLQHPVYETALLMEGLTLPISYMYALLAPVLQMRTDPEWRRQALDVLGCCPQFFFCCCCCGKGEEEEGSGCCSVQRGHDSEAPSRQQQNQAHMSFVVHSE
jgi:hypothetical protein